MKSMRGLPNGKGGQIGLGRVPTMKSRPVQQLIVFEWKKKKSVVFAVRVFNSERKLFRMHYVREGDLFVQPLIQTNEGATVALTEPMVASREQIEKGIKFDRADIDNHGYVSFHVSGTVKGPDYQKRTTRYEKGGHSTRIPKKLVAVCEQRPADPGAYPEVTDEDRARKNLIFIPSAPQDGMYPVINLEFFPERDIRHFSSEHSQYVAGLSAIDIAEEKRFVAFVRVEYVHGAISAHHQLSFRAAGEVITNGDS